MPRNHNLLKFLFFVGLMFWASEAHAAVAKGPVVSADTLTGKLVVGYQGWFGCPGDYDGNKSWAHWFADNIPDAAHLRVELLPDVSEYPKEALCPTGLKRPDGSSIELYSAQNAGAIDLHFRWMAQYGIDGATVQRFIGGTTRPESLKRFDHLLANERAGAEANGRIFYVTYDISGANPKTVIADIERDWRHLVNDLRITSSPRYLHDHGKPVLELWGFGVRDRPGTPDEVRSLIEALKTGTLGVPSVTVIGGVAPEWRTLDGSAKTDPAWAETYRAFDVISPWYAGRFIDLPSAARYLATRAADDLALTRRLGIGYMPVIFPGFSWSNLMRLNHGRRVMLNQIPRRCGDFDWTQIRSLIDMHVNMLYVAMFDEVDEGTAVFKSVSRQADLPVGTQMVALNQDGCHLPSDWYLRITGAANRYLRSGTSAPARLGDAVTP